MRGITLRELNPERSDPVTFKISMAALVLCVVTAIGLFTYANSVTGEYAAFIFEDQAGDLFVWDPEINEKVYVQDMDDIKETLRDFESRK